MEIKQEAIEEIIKRLAGILGKCASEFSEETAFDGLDLKSVNYSQLTTFLEDRFDVEVPYMSFRRCKTISEAGDYIASLSEA